MVIDPFPLQYHWGKRVGTFNRENTRKHAVFFIVFMFSCIKPVFMYENILFHAFMYKTCMYFLHLVPTLPHDIIAEKGTVSFPISSLQVYRL